MKLNATDIRIGTSGISTHYPIMICRSGVLIKFQGAKPRNIELDINETSCIITEDGKLIHIITAPFKIDIKNGIE